MNKITMIFLAGLLFAFESKSQTGNISCKIESYKKTGNNGEVWENDSYIYNTYNQLVEKKEQSYATRNQYDANNNLIKSTHYLTLGSERKQSETEYIYNTNNQLTKEVHIGTFVTSELNKISEKQYEYHNNGKMKKMIEFLPPFTTIDHTINYNEKGIMISIEYANGNKVYNSYNESGKKTKQITFDSKENTTTETTIEYNDKNLVVRIIAKTNGVIDYFVNSEYNDQNKIVSDIWYDKKHVLMFKTITTYTGENYKVINYNDKNQVSGYILYEIENGLEMKRTSYNKDKLQSSLISTYDNHRNKIKFVTMRYGANYTNTTTEEWTYKCD